MLKYYKNLNWQSMWKVKFPPLNAGYYFSTGKSEQLHYQSCSGELSIPADARKRKQDNGVR